MKTPSAPGSDEVHARHKYYGETVGAIDCLSERTNRTEDDVATLNNDINGLSKSIRNEMSDLTDDMTGKYIKVSAKLEKKIDIENIKRLGERIGHLEEYKIQNQTAWTIGRMGFFIVWIVFGGLVKWYISDLEASTKSKLDKLEILEQKVTKLEPLTRKVNKLDSLERKVNKLSENYITLRKEKAKQAQKSK